MEPFKSGFGVMRAVMPILYCGGLLYYFTMTDAGQVAMMLGVGRNVVVGLTVAGALAFIPLILKLVRIFARAHYAGRPHSNDDDKSGFDPDAAIARYMANRSTETVTAAPVARMAPIARSPGKPAGFGRRTR